METITQQRILGSLALTGALVAFFGYPCFKAYRLKEHGLAVPAVITALEPHNHQTVDFSYRVGSASFEGSGLAGFGNPAFDQLHVGEEVSAAYLPSNPSVSCLGSPQLLFKRSLNSLLLFGSILTAVIGWQLANALKDLTMRSS